MKKKYKVDYDVFVDCFQQIKNVETDLIYGDLSNIENPFISYIIPVYKRADLLLYTLDSVLNQEDADCEWDIVVVDNEAGGINETEELIRKIDSPRILYYRNRENLGVDGNYNRCIEMARGKWVAMIHGDDLITTDHLKNSLEYIFQAEKKRKKEPAYICQRYIDFSDKDEVLLDRNSDDINFHKAGWVLKQRYNNGNIEEQTQLMGMMTGFFAAVPSFGTLMNRQIMLDNGGFNVDLGICEDIITPFKLAKKYGVYMAPAVMGYHRFENNESMKIETIKKIYSSMVDFREYMYSRYVFGPLWGFIARDILNYNLRNYCIGLSRFSQRRLKFSDFDDIYIPKNTKGIKSVIFNLVISLFNKAYGLRAYDDMVLDLIESNYNKLKDVVDANTPIVLYGAGTASKSLIPQLKKKYGNINILACVVTSNEHADKIYNIPIYEIDRYQVDKKKVVVLTTTVIWQYQDEMNEKLRELGYEKVINLLN